MDHPETATCLHNVAGTPSEMGNYKGAYKKNSKSLEIREKALRIDLQKTHATVWWKEEIKRKMEEE